jgi:hypothetical protein
MTLVLTALLWYKYKYSVHKMLHGGIYGLYEYIYIYIYNVFVHNSHFIKRFRLGHLTWQLYIL